MNAVADSIDTPRVTKPVRAFSWLLRRELWEHRALWMTPAIIVVLLLVAALLGVMSGHLQPMPTGDFIDSNSSRALVAFVSMGIAGVFLVVMQIVWMFYTVDALNSERRDRSILFWKSLPLSDLQTVLAKIATVTVVAPAITFVAIVAAQLALLLIATIVLAAKGQASWMIWTQPALLSCDLLIAYTLAVLSVWFLPVYAWLLLVSAWARRSVMLWAVLPPIAIIVIEKISLGTTHFAVILGSRLGTGIRLAFNREAMYPGGNELSGNVLRYIDIPQLFSSVEFWAGIVVALGFIAAAVWMRRYREPL
jgi:ABC-2 type transport system permease protein